MFLKILQYTQENTWAGLVPFKYICKYSSCNFTKKALQYRCFFVVVLQNFYDIFFFVHLQTTASERALDFTKNGPIAMTDVSSGSYQKEFILFSFFEICLWWSFSSIWVLSAFWTLTNVKKQLFQAQCLLYSIAVFKKKFSNFRLSQMEMETKKNLIKIISSHLMITHNGNLICPQV